MAESTRIFGGQKVLLQETDRALTPFGGMVVFLEFLNRIGLVEKVSEWMMERLPPRAEGHSLDLDSTVFQRHGQQQE